MTTSQRKFIFVTIDYFTKWVELKPIATIIEERAKNLCSIITTHNTPTHVTVDNGK